MIQKIFYFSLGAISSAFVTQAGVPLWTHFSRLINWEVAREAAQDIGDVFSTNTKERILQNDE